MDSKTRGQIVSSCTGYLGMQRCKLAIAKPKNPMGQRFNVPGDEGRLGLSSSSVGLAVMSVDG